MVTIRHGVEPVMGIIHCHMFYDPTNRGRAELMTEALRESLTI